MKAAAVLVGLALCLLSTYAFHGSLRTSNRVVRRTENLQMNFFEDASRFFTNMNKEASAKHILIKGDSSMARNKLIALKDELSQADDLSAAFSDLAAKVSQCPSANRGGNLGTFKPGMMVKEFDKIVFEEAVGTVHGPVSTQFGEHLILITRRYEGEKKKEA
jgi:peptidyl-prolyl cis-trans isomerase C